MRLSWTDNPLFLYFWSLFHDLRRLKWIQNVMCSTFRVHWKSVQNVKKPDFFTEEDTELIRRNLHAHISGYTQVWQATQQNSSSKQLYMAIWRKCYGYASTKWTGSSHFRIIAFGQQQNQHWIMCDAITNSMYLKMSNLNNAAVVWAIIKVRLFYITLI